MFDERVELFKTAKRAIAGRCKLVCGTGCASTRETILLTKEAVKAGADFCLIVAPFYCKPDQEGIYLHYRRIAEETGAQIMLYNIPIFTGVNIDPATCARLAQIPNIFGIKDEAGVNPNQVLDYRLATKAARPDFIIFNGDDTMLLPTIAPGRSRHHLRHGSRARQDDQRRIRRLRARGQPRGARAFHRPLQILPLLGQVRRIHPNPVLRPAIELKTGLPIGPARGPLAPIRPEERQFLEARDERARTALRERHDETREIRASPGHHRPGGDALYRRGDAERGRFPRAGEIHYGGGRARHQPGRLHGRRLRDPRRGARPDDRDRPGGERAAYPHRPPESYDTRRATP